MAIIINITYSKKLGLPNYSSHSCSVSVQVEVADLNQVAEQNAKLYELLQNSVDQQIKQVGFLPDATSYGMHQNGNRPQNGNGSHSNGSQSQPPRQDSGISEKQLDLINSIVKQNNANKSDVESLAVEMFGEGVRSLNRLQASGFIDALFEKYPRQNNGHGNHGSGNGNGHRSNYPRQAAHLS